MNYKHIKSKFYLSWSEDYKLSNNKLFSLNLYSYSLFIKISFEFKYEKVRRKDNSLSIYYFSIFWSVIIIFINSNYYSN